MIKKNKIILISAGVITPIAITAITLPIVLAKKTQISKVVDNDKDIFNAISKKLQGLSDKKMYIFDSTNNGLNLYNKWDKNKIIEKIKKDYKLTNEDFNKLTIEGAGIITKIDFKNIKLKITINQKDKIINFKIKITGDKEIKKFDDLIHKVDNKEITIINNIKYDLTRVNDRANLLTKVKKEIISLINDEERNAVFSVATKLGKISTKWLAINFSVIFYDQPRTIILRIKNSV